MLPLSRAERARSRRFVPGEAGWGFIELVVSIAIVGVSLLVMLQQMTISHREIGLGHERVFGAQKALSILAEIQAMVERGEITDATDLDEFDDGGRSNPVLTTLTESGSTVDPAHAMSGNLRQSGHWVWSRTVRVEPVASSNRMRYVRIAVSRHPTPTQRVVAASIGAVVNLRVDAFAATQTFDVYVLACAAAPALSGTVEALRSRLTSAVATLEASTPGLDYRLRWITELGYGRDPRYVPWIDTTTSIDAAAPWAYAYPGLTAGGTRMFTPELFGGRVRDAGGVLNDYDVDENPEPFAVADRFNHCTRTPQARRTHTRRVLLGLEDPDEPPLQILLEDMCSAPEDYRNAIFLNLHGDAMPCPPLRNYADAAKTPERLPGVRAVTHPERLWTPRDPNLDASHEDTLDLRLRVYAYKTDPAAGASVLAAPVTLQIFGPDLSQNVNQISQPGQPATLVVDSLAGGVDRGGAHAGDLSYSPFAPAEQPETAAPNEMYFEAGFVASPVPYTWLKLHNTPLVAPPIAARGLGTAAHLYGLEYVPSPIDDSGTFATDLATLGGTVTPKNTARWRITIPRGVFSTDFPGGPWVDTDTLIDVVTRIGDDVTTGAAWPVAHEPANWSETFAWWTSSAQAVPATERYQFQGDPRHCPYADLAATGASFAHGYNWHFDDFVASGTAANPDHWRCIDFARLADGASGGDVVDAPRFLQLWRSALQACGGVLTHADGAAAGAVVVGGEIAGARTGVDLGPGTVRIHGDWFGIGSPVEYEGLRAGPVAVASAAPGGEVAIPTAPGGERHGRTLVVDTSSAFWAKPWLGELAPDDAGDFETHGNLSTTRFHHELRETATVAGLPPGTSFAFPSGSLAAHDGSAAMLQASSADGGPFVTIGQPYGSPGSMTAAALELWSAVGAAPYGGVTCRWPFALGGLAFPPPHHQAFAGSYPSQELEELGRVVDGDDLIGGSVLRISSFTGDAIVAMLGTAPSCVSEAERALVDALVLGVHALHVAGERPHDRPADQVPRISVTSPVPSTTFVEPSEIVVQWRTDFVRFDGEKYTPAYDETFAGDESDLGYVVMYSPDHGASWVYAADGTPALIGYRVSPTSIYWLNDAGVGNESFVLSVPEAEFPAGEYVVRVECHSAVRRPHYSAHQQVVRIRR